MLLITDSLGAPRSVKGETIIYEQTWVFMFSHYMRNHHGFDVISITQNGLSAEEVLQLTKEKLTLYEATIIIMQYGIVDCAPRILKEKEIQLLQLLRLSTFVHKILSKHHAFFSKLRNLQYTEIRKFKELIKQVHDIFKKSNIKVINIPIAPACQGYIRKSPEIMNNILLYNGILKMHCDFFLDSAYDNVDLENIFLSDLHHLNQTGHQIIFERLIHNVEKILFS